MVNFSSTLGSLQSCLQLQGLFTFHSTIYLIASNCIYELPQNRLLSTYWHPRLFLFDKTSKNQTVPIHWDYHARYREVVAEKKNAITGKTLLSHAFLLSRPNGPPSRVVDAIEMLDFVGGEPNKQSSERFYLLNGHWEKSPQLGMLLSGRPFNGVMNGLNGDQGYLLVVDNGAVAFYDRGEIVGYKAKPAFPVGYYLHFNPSRRIDGSGNGSEARFVRKRGANAHPEEEGTGWRGIPSSGGYPFGLQDHNSTILVDVHEENVYIFPNRPLDGSSKDIENKIFPVRTMPLRDFLSCKPKIKPSRPPPTLSFSTGHIVFVVVASMGTLCLLGLSIYAFYQRSSLSGAVVKRTKTRYKYQPFGRGRRKGGKKGEGSFGWSGGASYLASVTGTSTTDATKWAKLGGSARKYDYK